MTLLDFDRETPRPQSALQKPREPNNPRAARGACCAVILAALSPGCQKHQDGGVIRASRIELVDALGQVRVRLSADGGASIITYDDDGEWGVYIGNISASKQPGGRMVPRVVVYSKGGETALGGQIDPGVFLHNGVGHVVMALDEGGATLSMMPIEGQSAPGVLIGSGVDTGGLVSVSSSERTTSISGEGVSADRPLYRWQRK